MNECVFCHREAAETDACPGCGQHVCADCDWLPLVPRTSQHRVDAHQEILDGL